MVEETTKAATKGDGSLGKSFVKDKKVRREYLEQKLITQVTLLNLIVWTLDFLKIVSNLMKETKTTS